MTVSSLYAHQLDTWPHYTWDDARIGAQLRAVRAFHAALLRRVHAAPDELRTDLTVHALTQEVLASSAIEEEHLPPDQVRLAVQQHLGLTPDRAVNAGVRGAAQLTLDAHARAGAPLTERGLLAWHATLFQDLPQGPHLRVGAWRDDRLGPMQIVSGPAGRPRVHYEAPAAPRLPAEMTAFLTWLRDDPGDELIKAAVAHLWFVSIHPFDDGNGRVSRALTLRALARADGTPWRAYAAAPELLTERRAYYLTLERTQRSLDITDWLAWFLECLHGAMQAGDLFVGRWEAAQALWSQPHAAELNARQRKVLTLLLGEFRGALHARKYAKLTRCAPGDAEADLAHLTRIGLLRVGGPGPTYQLTPDFTPRRTP